MDLQEFSYNILGKDIPLNILKFSIFMLSNKEDSISIDVLVSKMFINKRKLTNEISKFRNIEGFLSIEISPDKWTFYIGEKKFYLNDTKTQNKKKKEANNEIDNVIKDIFDYWCIIMGKSNRTVLDQERIKAIKRGLDFCSHDECKQTILGCSKSLWHMGKLESNTKQFNSLSLIFKNQDKIETFISYSDLPSIEEQIKNQSPKKDIESRINNNDWFNERQKQFGNMFQNKQEESNCLENNNNQNLIENKIKKYTPNNLIENKMDINNILKLSEKEFNKQIK